MGMPKEYEGREQSYLKHEVLRHYLGPWGAKLGSIGRKRHIKLWYVDCFSGPWQSSGKDLEDTSIAIGLSCLREAATTWSQAKIEVAAIFVEQDRAAYDALCVYLDRHKGAIETHALHGAFGDHVGTIDAMIGDSPAFLFVDPTGWKGVNMRFIASLARKRFRDVLVNVMTNDIARFHDDRRVFLRRQMQDFFGLDTDAVISRMTEDELMEFYRAQFKEVAGLPYSADLAIPHPTHERTWFRLVVGGHDSEVLKVFRAAEKKVLGGIAPEVRDEARRRKREAKSSQFELVLSGVTAKDRGFEQLREDGLQAARAEILTVWT